MYNPAMKIMTRFVRWLRQPQYRWLKTAVFLLILLTAAYLSYKTAATIYYFKDSRNRPIIQWATGDESDRAALVTVQREACTGAPFILPADGFIGLLYADPRGPYSRFKPHQGIDIFSEGEAGETAVYAAYDGYVTRESNWISTLIMRVPQDPLAPDEQIWLYYTHMADKAGNDFIEPAFAPGTTELFVEQGTLLGYTGDYSPHDVWVHLHFSIVKDDGNGRYLNELNFNNTKDPSPYFRMNMNYHDSSGTVTCQ